MPRDGYVELAAVVVWFCAKRYAGVRLNHHAYSYTNYDAARPEATDRVFWSEESLAKAARAIGFSLDDALSSRRNLTAHFESPAKPTRRNG